MEHKHTPVLTDAAIEACRIAGGGIVEDFARAIEQAVLQSPEVQQMRMKAARYDYLRDMPTSVPANGVEVAIWEDESGEAIRGSDLDVAIDAAMETKGMSKVTMPDPVAAMWKDRHGGRMMPTIRFSSWPPFEPLAEFDALITTAQAEAYADARVREALEEAAQAVHLRLYPNNDRSDWTEFAHDQAKAAEAAMSVIRALIPSTL